VGVSGIKTQLDRDKNYMFFKKPLIRIGFHTFSLGLQVAAKPQTCISRNVLTFTAAENSSSESWYRSQVMWKCDSTTLENFRTTFFCKDMGERSLYNDLTTDWTVQVLNPGRG
jgi:hypothetical protein